MPRLEDIQIRDPFIVPFLEERLYYLFGTTDPNCWEGPGTGFDVYTSRDLEEWNGPIEAFRPPAGFWADTNFWAPEVHRWNGRWFLFATFKKAGWPRSTQILPSGGGLAGPYVPCGDLPITPSAWECLDGSLFVDESGKPWIVFSREWVEIGDGEVHAMPLAPDLMTAAGPPELLFRASEAPWVVPNRSGGFVTDGPFVWRTAQGELLLLWSSFANDGYALACAQSASGSIEGPWRHETAPLVVGGGHGMLFRTFAGALRLVYHAPDRTPEERAVILPVIERNGILGVVRS